MWVSFDNRPLVPIAQMDMSLGVWVGDQMGLYVQRIIAAGVDTFLALSHKDDSGRQLYSV